MASSRPSEASGMDLWALSWWCCRPARAGEAMSWPGKACWDCSALSAGGSGLGAGHPVSGRRPLDGYFMRLFCTCSCAPGPIVDRAAAHDAADDAGRDHEHPEHWRPSSCLDAMVRWPCPRRYAPSRRLRFFGQAAGAQAIQLELGGEGADRHGDELCRAHVNATTRQERLCMRLRSSSRSSSSMGRKVRWTDRAPAQASPTCSAAHLRPADRRDARAGACPLPASLPGTGHVAQLADIAGPAIREQATIVVGRC